MCLGVIRLLWSVSMRPDVDPIFGKGQQLWESYCGQGVTWIIQVPNVIIGHVQDIVLGF